MVEKTPGFGEPDSNESSPQEGPDSAPQQRPDDQEPVGAGSQDASQDGALSREAVLAREIRKAVMFQAELGEQVRRGKAALAQSGVMPGGTGPGTYGYDFNPEERRRVVNEVEAAIVLRVFGDFDEGKTVRSITQELNDEGVSSKQGKRWRPAMVLNLLRNESYVGVSYYGKTRTVRGPYGALTKVSTDRSDWIRITGFSPPLVPEELFWRVQAKLSRAETRALVGGGIMQTLRSA